MISKKRIRKLNPYKNQLPASDGAFVAFVGATEHQLRRAGFGKNATEGATVLPNRVGKITRYNAEGRRMKQMNAPMETVYHTTMRHWKDWHGNDHSGLVDIPYKRRPRRFIAPPSIEITLHLDSNGNATIVSSLIENWGTNDELFVHVINMFLELFGECEIFDDKKTKAESIVTQRVNWKVLPAGEYPFERLKQELEPILGRLKKSDRMFAEGRIEYLEKFEPEKRIVGLSGFSGYTVFAYPKHNLYILECSLYGNATYILNHDWQETARLTKAEILNNNLHKDRIIHRANWFSKVKDLFDNHPESQS